MHAPLPHHLYVTVSNKFISDCAGSTRAVLHGVYTRPGQVVYGNLLLETGAHWSGVPLHGITHLDAPTVWSDHDCQPWGCMGTQPFMVLMPYLEGLGCEIKGVKGRHSGMILDWYDGGFIRSPEQHKPLSLLLMDNGHIALYPNNYIRFYDPSFVDPDLWDQTKNYRRNTRTYWPELQAGGSEQPQT